MSDVQRPADADSRPHSGSRHLPPYRGILAVDAKDFTGHPAVQHEYISRSVPQLLERAFARCGLSEIWESRRFPASTGDGYVFGYDPAWLPFVVHPWLPALQDVLAEFALHAAGAVRIRLRVSLHVGPLPDSGGEFAGNGTPRNDTHRLLDSRPVKGMLAASDENVTYVAAILSDRCYQDAVASGYTGRHPEHFIEVPATVEGKQFDQRAYLYVPTPSGSLFDRRILGERVMRDHGAPTAPGGDAAPPRPRGQGTSTHRTTVNNRADRGNLNTGTLHGGQSVTNNDASHGGHVGDIAGDQMGGVGGDHVRGDRISGFAGDYVRGDRHGGNRAETVRGDQGDTHRGGPGEADR
ncbi:hypothetical protein [Streptomyces spiramenti]|uniref:Uncharacterized protein n=1 Tax=Streptomyces spiramenti TaxID=2720606 RepID=A0ABX1AL71_9ACTN|nr:hypothetical protein [Streptomyces spiramenti]